MHRLSRGRDEPRGRRSRPAARLPPRQRGRDHPRTRSSAAHRRHALGSCAPAAGPLWTGGRGPALRLLRARRACTRIRRKSARRVEQRRLFRTGALMTLADRLRQALALPPAEPPLEGDLPEVRAQAEIEAALLIAITDRTEPGAILTLRREHLRTHARQGAFPRGRIGEGEDADAAALRDAHEEV